MDDRKVRGHVDEVFGEERAYGVPIACKPRLDLFLMQRSDRGHVLVGQRADGLGRRLAGRSREEQSERSKSRAQGLHDDLPVDDPSKETHCLNRLASR